MSVLVTEGAGYIGSHVVLEFLDAGEEPIILDDLSTGFRNAVPRGAKFFRGDAGDERLVSRVIAKHGVEAIIHLAASVVVLEFDEKSARLLPQQCLQGPEPD